MKTKRKRNLHFEQALSNEACNVDKLNQLKYQDISIIDKRNQHYVHYNFQTLND